MQSSPNIAIRKIMVIKGFKQSVIAKRAGFTEQQFSDMLNGRKIIRAEFIPRIADALEVEPNDLFAAEQSEAI